MITCNDMMTSPQQDVSIRSEKDEIVLSGVSGWHEGLKGKVTFTGRATARIKGGRMSSDNGVLQISGADEATIYLTIATCFKHYDDISGNDTLQSENTLRQAVLHDFSSLKTAHTQRYQQLYDRVKLCLGNDHFAHSLAATCSSAPRSPALSRPPCRVYGTTRCCLHGTANTPATSTSK